MTTATPEQAAEHLIAELHIVESVRDIQCSLARVQGLLDGQLAALKSHHKQFYPWPDDGPRIHNLTESHERNR